MSLARQLRTYWLQLTAVFGLVALATVVGGYILSQQRLRFPWEDVYTIQADFTSSQAVTPGQGQTVAVAGVELGEVKEVRLVDGKARVTLEIERPRLKQVYANARMALRPKTGLQDMTVQLDPGTPDAPVLDEDDVVPASQTVAQVNADELLAALDQDTRAWLRTVLQAGALGTKDQGKALRQVLKAGAPTLRDTKRVTAAVLGRRQELRRLVHDLRLVAEAAAERDTELASLVATANETFGGLAAQDAALRTTLTRLPGTLDAAGDALAAARPFARELGPTAAALVPAVRALQPALPRVDPLLRDGLPAAEQVRGLVRDAKAPVKALRPTIGDLQAVTPSLDGAFDVLTRVVNELAHNPEGPEEGYLFWTAWFFHNAASILSVEDAQGVMWRGSLILSCSSYAALQDLSPLLTLVVRNPGCPTDRSGEVRG